MKRITIVFLLLFALATTINAQDVKKVRTVFTLAQIPSAGAQKLDDAKTEIDKVMADPKSQNSAEAWALKTEIYGLIAGNETLRAKYPNANTEALQALKKYLELDPTEKIIKEDRYAGVNPIYSSLFNEGVKLYNEKNWEGAFEKFNNVVDISDILIKRKWSNSSFDTTAYLYAGVTAQNAKKDAEANKFYGALAEHKVKGKDYEGIYEYLTKYNLNNKNEADFKKYLALAKEAYPTNDLWNDLETLYTTKNSNIEDIAKKFDADDAAGTLTSSAYFDMGNFFVNDKKVRDLEPAQRAQYTKKAVYAFTKAYEKDTSNALASYNVGVTNYAQWEDAYDAARQIKGTTADIKAKRATADKQADAAADATINWLEKSFNSLSAKKAKGSLSNLEKGCLSKSVDFLYNLYAYKKDRSRGVNPKDYDKFDAKAKYYDALHGKV
jgi:hypothetical protein